MGIVYEVRYVGHMLRYYQTFIITFVRRSRAFPETRIIRFAAIDFTKFFVTEHCSSAERYDATLYRVETNIV